MTTTATHAATSAAAGAPARSRTWAFAGALAGAFGVASIIASTTIDAAYNEATQGDSVAIMDRLGDQVPNLLLFGAFTVFATALLVPFAAAFADGSRTRRLRAACCPMWRSAACC